MAMRAVARRAPGGPPKAEPGADAGPAAPLRGAALIQNGLIRQRGAIQHSSAVTSPPSVPPRQLVSTFGLLFPLKISNRRRQSEIRIGTALTTGRLASGGGSLGTGCTVHMPEGRHDPPRMAASAVRPRARQVRRRRKEWCN